MVIKVTTSQGSEMFLPVDEIETLQVVRDSLSLQTIIITHDAEEVHVMENLLELADKISSAQEPDYADRFTI